MEGNNLLNEQENKKFKKSKIYVLVFKFPCTHKILRMSWKDNVEKLHIPAIIPRKELEAMTPVDREKRYMIEWKVTVSDLEL